MSRTFLTQLPSPLAIIIPAIIVPVSTVPELSMERSSIPTPLIGKLFDHQACGVLLADQFGMYSPGVIVTCQGSGGVPEPETAVTVTGCCWPRPGRPFWEPFCCAQVFAVWQIQTCPVSVVESSN